MTQKEIIELVQQHHPHMRNTEIRKLLDRAQDSFCIQTEILEKPYTTPSVANKRYYTLSDEIIKVLSVQFDDVEIPRLMFKDGYRLPIEDDEFV